MLSNNLQYRAWRGPMGLKRGPMMVLNEGAPGLGDAKSVQPGPLRNRKRK